jgi:hypothetical protein
MAKNKRYSKKRDLNAMKVTPKKITIQYLSKDPALQRD